MMGLTINKINNPNQTDQGSQGGTNLLQKISIKKKDALPASSAAAAIPCSASVSNAGQPLLAQIPAFRNVGLPGNNMTPYEMSPSTAKRSAPPFACLAASPQKEEENKKEADKVEKEFPSIEMVLSQKQSKH